MRHFGELSADRTVLRSFQHDVGTQSWLQWINLPLDEARSTAPQLVFAAAGPTAAQHVVTAYGFVCADNHSGIDCSKPVFLELWLGP